MSLITASPNNIKNGEKFGLRSTERHFTTTTAKSHIGYITSRCKQVRTLLRTSPVNSTRMETSGGSVDLDRSVDLANKQVGGIKADRSRQ